MRPNPNSIAVLTTPPPFPLLGDPPLPKILRQDVARQFATRPRRRSASPCDRALPGLFGFPPAQRSPRPTRPETIDDGSEIEPLPPLDLAQNRASRSVQAPRPK